MIGRTSRLDGPAFGAVTGLFAGFDQLRPISAIAGMTLALTAAAPLPPVLDVPVGGLVSGSIEGSVVRLLVAADGLSYPVLDPAVATRLSLSSSVFSVQARVGSATIPGKTGVIRIGVGTASDKRRALWFERASILGVDAVIGPETVGQSVVTFHLRAPGAGERRYLLPLVRKGGRLGTAMQIGGAPTFVQWNLQREVTLATAATAQDLATANGARFEGPPRAQTIRFQIERPTRRLTLAVPLMVGPIRLSSITARVSDYGQTGAVPDADGDPGEIVVVARKGKDRSEHILTIGTRDLTACSSVSFDKAAKTIALTCSD